MITEDHQREEHDSHDDISGSCTVIHNNIHHHYHHAAPPGDMQGMRYRVLVEAIDPSQGPDLVFVMQA